MIRSMKNTWFLSILLTLIIMTGITSATVRERVPFCSPELEQTLSGLAAMMDPDMPNPLLTPEPEFTWGSQNTVFWNLDSVQTLADSMDVTLIAFEVEAQFGATVLWGFTDADVDSALFRFLPEGMAIDYRLRYYAQTATGQFRMSFWSLPERSIQDQEPPRLQAWTIPDLQHTQNLDWISGNVLWNHVIASDSVYGKVMQIALLEESDGMRQTTFYDIETPSIAVDTLVPYPMLTPSNTVLRLSLWVIDVAGKASADTMHHTLFWWPYEEDPEQILCYPNPFRPAEGEVSVIKVNMPDIAKARIFDPFGNLVIELRKPVSRNFFEWNGLNQSGHPVSRGGYVLVIDGQENLYCKIAVY